MARPDISRIDIPVGPLRDMELITLTSITDDYVDERGFIIQVAVRTNATNNLDATTLLGSAISFVDVTNNFFPQVAGIPTLFRSIQASTDDITSVWIGRL